MTKTFAYTTAALFSILALSPIGSALHAGEDGNLSRSFLSLGSIDWDPHTDNPSDGIGGAGWYDPDDRDGLCLLRVFGVGLGVGFYYESLRHTTNSPDMMVTSFAEQSLPVGSTCPPAPIGNPSVTGNQHIGTSGGEVWVGGQVGQSHLLCLDTFDTCLADPDTARWWMEDCDRHDPPTSAFNDGLLLQFVPLGASGLEDSGCNGPNQESYNFTTFLSGQLGNQSSLVNPHVDQVVPDGDGTTWVRSCYSIDYQRVPSVPPFTPVDEESESHDYFVVLDQNDLPTTLSGAATSFLSGPTGSATHTGFSGSLAMEGLYDLSGDNGFRCDGPASSPHP